MSKVTFTKLQLKKKNDSKEFIYNDQTIIVKQYLPIQEKLTLIENVLNASGDEYNFANPIKLDMFLSLEIMYHYTNITFTEKQKEDPAKLFDLLDENEVISKVIALIPEEEYRTLYDGVVELSENIYTYQNSLLGIMDAVNRDYANLDLEATDIQQKLKDPENLQLLKNVLTKLG